MTALGLIAIAALICALVTLAAVLAGAPRADRPVATFIALRGAWITLILMGLLFWGQVAQAAWGALQ